MVNGRKLITVIVFPLIIVGCGERNHQDLRDFMEDAKNKPAGEIEPLPTFPTYQTFKYGALTLRSPFDPPLQIVAQETTGRSAVKPDESRKKEYLEGFNFSSMSMVGVVVKDDVFWSLIDDGAGGVHKVRVGNYLGKNHGRIVNISRARVDVVEIVPDGKGNWVERPRTLALKETNK